MSDLSGSIEFSDLDSDALSERSLEVDGGNSTSNSRHKPASRANASVSRHQVPENRSDSMEISDGTGGVSLGEAESSVEIEFSDDDSRPLKKTFQLQHGRDVGADATSAEPVQRAAGVRSKASPFGPRDSGSGGSSAPAESSDSGSSSSVMLTPSDTAVSDDEAAARQLKPGAGSGRGDGTAADSGVKEEKSGTAGEMSTQSTEILLSSSASSDVSDSGTTASNPRIAEPSVARAQDQEQMVHKITTGSEKNEEDGGDGRVGRASKGSRRATDASLSFTGSLASSSSTSQLAASRIEGSAEPDRLEKGAKVATQRLPAAAAQPPASLQQLEAESAAATDALHAMLQAVPAAIAYAPLGSEQPRRTSSVSISSQGGGSSASVESSEAADSPRQMPLADARSADSKASTPQQASDRLSDRSPSPSSPRSRDSSDGATDGPVLDAAQFLAAAGGAGSRSSLQEELREAASATDALFAMLGGRVSHPPSPSSGRSSGSGEGDADLDLAPEADSPGRCSAESPRGEASGDASSSMVEGCRGPRHGSSWEGDGCGEDDDGSAGEVVVAPQWRLQPQRLQRQPAVPVEAAQSVSAELQSCASSASGSGVTAKAAPRAVAACAGPAAAASPDSDGGGGARGRVSTATRSVQVGSMTEVGVQVAFDPELRLLYPGQQQPILPPQLQKAPPPAAAPAGGWAELTAALERLQMGAPGGADASPAAQRNRWELLPGPAGCGFLPVLIPAGSGLPADGLPLPPPTNALAHMGGRPPSRPTAVKPGGAPQPATPPAADLRQQAPVRAGSWTLPAVWPADGSAAASALGAAPPASRRDPIGMPATLESAVVESASDDLIHRRLGQLQEQLEAAKRRLLRSSAALKG